MSAYIIGNISVKDSGKWAEYCSQVPSTLVPFGGELVLRGTLISVLSGQYSHGHSVVIRFPNNESVSQWYSSDEYQKLIPLRTLAADVDLVSFNEGI